MDRIEQSLAAIAGGDLTAYHTCAWEYENLKDLEQAERYYRLSIEHENKATPISVFNLACLLRDTNREEAIALLERIKDDDVDALYMLGRIVRWSDPVKAIEYFEAGAERNSGACMCGLGNLYEFQRQDYSKAFELYTRGIAARHGPSVVCLSRMYQTGHGVPKDLDKEFEILSTSLPYDELTPVGKYNLAWFYKNRPANRNYAESLRIHEELDTEHSDPDSRLVLGEHYAHGLGVEKDPAKAVAYYVKSGLALAYEKLLHLSRQAEYKQLIPLDDQVKYFRQMMKQRIMHPSSTSSKQLTLSCEMLETLMSSVFDAERRLLEYELAPPGQGGRLYWEAHADFTSQTL